MSVCEKAEDNDRQNYSKILMHKSMFINLPLQNQKRELNSAELEEWKTRQLAEREKIRLAESTPEPPERPPKRPDLGLKNSKCILFTTPKPYIPGLSNTAKPFSTVLGKSFLTETGMEVLPKIDGLEHTKQISKKMKPMVPPKPVLTKETKTYLNCRRVSTSSSELLSSSSSSEAISSLTSKSSITSSTLSSHLTTIKESMSLNETIKPTSNHQISNQLSYPAFPSKTPFSHQTNDKTSQIEVSTAYSTNHNNEINAGNFSKFLTTNENALNFGAFSATNEKNYDDDSGISINNSTAGFGKDDNRTSFDDNKTGFVGPQRARLVRVDSQMSDYSVCDINLENVKNLSGFEGSSSHHDVNQNVKSSLNLRRNSLSLEKSETQEKEKLEELQKIKREKNLLISRIKSKLEIIREERDLVKNEIVENDNTVEEMISKLTSIARIRDIDRIRRHSEEVGSLASLIQCLSYRLEKLENDKSTTNGTANSTDLQNHFITSNNARFSPIKRTGQISPILSSHQKEEKLSKLESQLEDAKQLRELSNKRRINLTQLISELLEEKDGTMFSFCMKEKTRLTLELREFEDKIRSGEEHLNNLMTI